MPSMKAEQQGQSRPEQGPKEQDKMKMRACQHDEMKLSETWAKQGILCSFNNFAVRICWVPRGSQSLGAQAGASWDLSVPPVGDGHSPVPPSPSAPASSKLSKKVRTSKPPSPLTSVQPGVGRVTNTTCKIYIFPPRWKLSVHNSKEIPKV